MEYGNFIPDTDHVEAAAASSTTWEVVGRDEPFPGMNRVTRYSDGSMTVEPLADLTLTEQFDLAGYITRREI